MGKRTICIALWSLTGGSALLAFAAPSVLAQDDQGTRFVVGDINEIVVTSREQLRQTELPGSVDLISRSQLENEHVNLTMDLFKKIPGVSFGRYDQGVISMDMAIRGFNTEGDIAHTKLLIDGIPSNLHVGVGEMDAIFPLALNHIEVVKGTHDPRYGLLNIAGNINMTTRRDIAREVEVLGGSFGTYEAQAYAGLDSGAWTQHYFAGHRETDGYRDHAGMSKSTISGKWFHEGERLSLGLITRLFQFDADAPGFLSQADARATPQRSYDFSSTDGGEKDTRHVSLHLDYDFSDTLLWSGKGYVQNFRRQRWVRFTEGGLQQERLEDEDQAGFVSTLSWQPQAATQVNWGVDLQLQDNENQRFRTAERTRTGQVLRDQAFDYNVYGSYLQWQQDIGSDLMLSAALRADRLEGDSIDRLTGIRRDINDYGTILQPKFSLLYSLTDELSFYANAGRGFQSGLGLGAYPAPGNEVDVSVNDGWDIGVSAELSDSLETRLSLWRQTASEELALRGDGTGTVENIGKTTRNGWELTFNWRPSEAFYLWGSYSDQQAELTEPGPANASVRGNDLHHMPGYNASLGLEYHVNDRLTATLFTSWQDDYYLANENNVGRFGDYALTDFTLSQAMDWGDIGFRVHNLFDHYYEYAWFDGDVTLHAPGAERYYDLSVSVRF